MLKIELSYRGMMLIGLALLSLWAVLQLWPVLLLVITSFIFMAALLPYVEWLCRRRVPRVAAVLIILLVIVAMLAAMVAIVVPAVIDEFRNLRANLPQDAHDFEAFMSRRGFDTDSWDLEERARRIDWTGFISGRAAVDYGQRVIFGVVSGLTVVVLTAYLLLETPRLSTFLYRLVPVGRQPD